MIEKISYIKKDGECLVMKEDGTTEIIAQKELNKRIKNKQYEVIS